MSESKEYAEAAAALIRVKAAGMSANAEAYRELAEVKAAERAEGIAIALNEAAALLREYMDPPYDAKAAAASHLAGAVYRYLDDLDAKGIADTENMIAALEAYDAIDDDHE